nr:transposase [uncultured Ruminococcus sp.]
MENGYESLRKIEKLCKTDIRFMWLLQDNPPPSHSTMSIMTYRLSCCLHISIWTKQLKDFMANSFSSMTTDVSKF